MEPISKILNDTICAISTPAGRGGIAVIRLSGPQALEIAGKRWHGARLETVPSHTVHLGSIFDAKGMTLDQAVATVFRGPRSYTGEDTVEFSVHGSPWIQREVLDSLTSAGARIAWPGEFTQRAFTNGRLDLAQAEAVGDIIASSSRAAHRVAMNQMRGGFSRDLNALRDRLIDLASLLELELDFSHEDVEFASRTQLIDLATELLDHLERLHGSFRAGNALKEGIIVAIVGATNAGKSSLLNALLNDERAIVSDIHGTTRDTIEETIEIGDYLFRFIDTAGLRETDDAIERIGIERSYKAISQAHIVLHIIDSTQPDSQDLKTKLAKDAVTITIANKSDLSQAQTNVQVDLFISALTGDGLPALRDKLTEIAASLAGDMAESSIITNARHAEALSKAAESITRVLNGLRSTLPADLIAQDLRETIHHLSAITATITTPDLLQNIFSKFCIGK